MANVSPKTDGYSANGWVRGDEFTMKSFAGHDKLLWFVVWWKCTGNGRTWGCWKTLQTKPRWVSSNNTTVSLCTFYRQIILSNSLLWIILVGSCRYLHPETSAPGSLRHYLLLAHDLTWAPKNWKKYPIRVCWLVDRVSYSGRAYDIPYLKEIYFIYIYSYKWIKAKIICDLQYTRWFM